MIKMKRVDSFSSGYNHFETKEDSFHGSWKRTLPPHVQDVKPLQEAINKAVLYTLSDTLVSYDTLKIFLRGTHHINHNALQPFRGYKNLLTGGTTQISKLEELTIIEKPDSVSIRGSFPKFLNNHNLTPLTLQEIELVFEKISDILNIDIRNGTVSRIDVASNLSMEEPVGEYLLFLSSAPRCDRKLYGNKTLNLSNKNKTLTFYDKLAEMKQSGKFQGIDIPQLSSELNPINILRYECQFKKAGNNFPNGLRAHLLTDKNTYIKLLEQWKKNYDSITKCRYRLSPVNDYYNIDSLDNDLRSIGINNFGGMDRVMEQVDNLRRLGMIDRQQKKRYKDKLKLTLVAGNDQSTNKLIKELDDKLGKAYQNTLERLR